MELCGHAERLDSMENNNSQKRMVTVARIMAAVGAFGALAAVAMRVWLSPAKRDVDTGLFADNILVIMMMLLVLVALGVMALLTRGGQRQEITGRSSLVLAVALLAVGSAFAFTGVADIISTIRNATPEATQESGAQSMQVLQWLQRGFCLLGGAMLVRFGLVLASESATRRGMAQWSLLAPVLWAWFQLANYEMSYASMVRLSDGFFTLMTYVTEMLFFFYLARYIAGVGKVGACTLLFFSSATTAFAISTPLVRIIMYLQQDAEAYAAAGTTGYLDLAVGLLALVVSITLCQSLSVVPVTAPEETDEEKSERLEMSEAFPAAELIEESESTEEPSERLEMPEAFSAADLIEEPESIEE